MARKIENTPSPHILMNSMRSIGYTFKTALADIIDNAISANATNVYVDSPINDMSLFITILDDGFGMERDDLLNAMKYGSDRESYSATDLGRFGLGLKSASLSQCRVLTVASKHENKVSAFRRDLDFVVKDKRWDCLELEEDEIDEIPNISKLRELSQGTLVVWQNFDGAYKKSGGLVREYLMDEIDESTKHLQLVFHRYLNRKIKPLNIYINNDKLIGFDPFLEDHPKTDTKKPSELSVENSIIKIQTYILPHQTDLSNADIDKLGGIDSLRTGQGFYVYRNDRLIIYGTWFRLSSSNINHELFKYGRIKVDIPNNLDDMWDIDIKKQNAVVPKAILNNLKKTVSTVCGRSKDKTAKRTRLTFEKDDTKIWNKSLSRNNKDVFFINPDSSFVKNFLDDFDDKDRAKILNFIDVVSSSIPFEDIYNSVCNKSNENDLADETISSLVLEGVSQFKRIKMVTQKSNKDCFERLCSFEPFNNEVISARIWEAVKDEQ